jgi:hypothetical protein
MNNLIPGWVPKSWTDRDAWAQSYSSWTSREEWQRWYSGSKLESAASATGPALKSAATIGADFVITLLDPPAQMALGTANFMVRGAQTAQTTFEGMAKEAYVRFSSPQEEESSWLMCWFKSIGKGFSQFLATVWQFLKSPFILTSSSS